MPIQDGIALGFFFVAMILGVIFLCFKRKTSKQKFAQKAKEKGWVTEGRSKNLKFQVWDSPEDIKPSSSTTTVWYEYEVYGQTYEVKRKFYSNHEYGANTPHTIAVYYDPENPKKVVCSTEIGKHSGCYMGCLMTIGLSVAVFHLVRILLQMFFP